MSSISHNKFRENLVGAAVIKSNFGNTSSACSDQLFVDQTLLKASVALAVGCWEGYVESVIREFISKIRLQTQRNSWGLISQFEFMVDKKASSLNTPNWEKTRELIIEVTGMDPYAGWIWSPRFLNQTDTKAFFDGIMSVRHSFAHGFDIPPNIPGLTIPRVLDLSYTNDSLSFLDDFAKITDDLLEHELKFRHACRAGWN